MRKLSRVAVSGATSFLGSHVVKKLLDRGCDVYGIVRETSHAFGMLPNHPRFHTVVCDISDTETWGRAINNADTFFHFAWGGPGIQGRSDATVQRKSAENAINAFKMASKMGVSRFFLSGSQAEYGKINGMISEATPCNPILEYGKNKLKAYNAASNLAAELGVEYVHARFFSVYGHNDHPYTLIPSSIRCFLGGERMELSECANMWNFIHADDAAEASVLLAECDLREPSTVVNLAGTDTRILREFVEEIHRLCGNKGECAFGARHVTERPVDNWPDITKLLAMIRWTPKVTFDEGIRSLIAEELRIRGNNQL